MASEKVDQAKETVADTAEQVQQFGEEKGADAKSQIDSANKEAQSQLEAADKSDDPTFADKAREKAAQAQQKATDTQQKVTDAVTDGWAKTKTNFNNLNQYPDKK